MERLTKLLLKSKIFNYFRTNGNVHNVHKKLQDAVYQITIDSLCERLTEEQKGLLLATNWVQPDPNYPDTAQKISIIKQLINDACFSSMHNDDWPLQTKLFIYDTQEKLGIDSEEKVSLIISEINKIWKEDSLASISYVDRHICFEIFLRK